MTGISNGGNSRVSHDNRICPKLIFAGRMPAFPGAFLGVFLTPDEARQGAEFKVEASRIRSALPSAPSISWRVNSP